MGISEELGKLHELHQSGVLTAEEFAAAKTKLLGPDPKGATELAAQASPTSIPQAQVAPAAPSPSTTTRKASVSPVRTILVVIVGLIAIVMLRSLWLSSSPRTASSAGSLPALLPVIPVQVTDVVESLPARSVKGIPLHLPYSGTLRVEVSVVRGNPVDIFLVSPSEKDAVLNNKEFHHFGAFEATKSSTYSRDGRRGSTVQGMPPDSPRRAGSSPHLCRALAGVSTPLGAPQRLWTRSRCRGPLDAPWRLFKSAEPRSRGPDLCHPRCHLFPGNRF
jgi:hypothetical protein